MLWDVGHQAYPHKVLTGRRDQLQTIRKYEGLAPFCSIAESEHDIMGAGHASTAIGYAVGLKEAMRHGEAQDGKVVAVVGDGAMTGGVAFEAVHQAGGLGTPLVVILNDNGMSIAPNVGALSAATSTGCGWIRACGRRARASRRSSRGCPAASARAFERLGPQLKESVKALWQPGLWWEELDWAYMGVIDGHDVRAVRKALRAAFEAERPVVIHVATVKGKGFAPAEDGGLEGMEKWHAAKPKSIADRRPAPSGPKKAAPPPQYTQVFGEAMVRECERDERVVGITAAMNSGTGLSILQKAMPDRYFDVGIAEQQAVLFAAGLALQGTRPVAAIYSTFLQRAFDQIVHDVCLQNLNVTFCMDRAGLVGDDGPTHHGAFDIAYLRPLPNITLMAPRDEAMLVHMLHTALNIDGPAAIRYPRGEAEGVDDPAEASLLEVGTGEILREGERVAIVGYGSGVGKALGAADLLAEQRARRHRRRRPLREAARRRPAGPARRRARPRRDRRGGRADGRVRQRGLGVAVRRRRRRRGCCASACPTAMSPTARRSCSTRRSASRPSGSPSGSRPPVLEPRSRLARGSAREPHPSPGDCARAAPRRRRPAAPSRGARSSPTCRRPPLRTGSRPRSRRCGRSAGARGRRAGSAAPRRAPLPSRARCRRACARRCRPPGSKVTLRPGSPDTE